MASDVPHSQTPPDTPVEGLDGTKGRIKLQATIDSRSVFVISRGPSSVRSPQPTFTVQIKLPGCLDMDILPAGTLPLPTSHLSSPGGD